MELSETAIRELLHRALDYARPWEAEAILAGGHGTVLRFANNRFHQNTRENRWQLYLRVLQGKHTGAVYLDDFSDQSLREAVERARRSALADDEVEGLLPLPDAQIYRESPGRYHPQSFPSDLTALSERFACFFEQCERAGLEAAGKLELVDGTIGDYGELSPLALANSRGLFVFSPSTWFDFSTTVFDPRSNGQITGWSGNAGHRWEDFSFEAMTERALQKARLNRAPRDLPPGEYPVILEPAAVRELLTYLGAAFNAQAVLEERSFVGDKRGKVVFPSWLSLWDDAFRFEIGGRPFDGEGMPVQPVALIDRGTVKGWVNTRELAKRLGESPTGHGHYLPNPYGASATNLVMAGGEKSLEALIAESDRAILVTRVWYTTSVDEKRLVVSGMTRDGTFLVEKGKVVGSVKNLRFNQSLPDLFESVSEVGRPELCFGWLVPPLRAERFHFTSATTF